MAHYVCQIKSEHSSGGSIPDSDKIKLDGKVYLLFGCNFPSSQIKYTVFFVINNAFFFKTFVMVEKGVGWRDENLILFKKCPIC